MYVHVYVYVYMQGPVWDLCKSGDLLFSASSDNTIKVPILFFTHSPNSQNMPQQETAAAACQPHAHIHNSTNLTNMYFIVLHHMGRFVDDIDQ